MHSNISLYNAVRKTLGILKSNHDARDIAEILMQEILDYLRADGDLSDDEYTTLWAEFLPTEEHN